MNDNTALITLKNVGKTYYLDHVEVQALKTVDLEIKRGEFISIAGPSGSGKTTLLHIIGCLLRPTAGEYLIHEHLVWQYSQSRIAALRNKTIGFVFQNFNLMGRLNALDNVIVPLVYGRVPYNKRKILALKALENVGLGSRVNHFPNQLSGGEQQRVAIARALVMNPDIILADEPTGNLDSKTGEEILNIMKTLHVSGRTVIIVTHDERIAHAAETQVRLKDGLRVLL